MPPYWYYSYFFLSRIQAHVSEERYYREHFIYEARHYYGNIFMRYSFTIGYFFHTNLMTADIQKKKSKKEKKKNDTRIV